MAGCVVDNDAASVAGFDWSGMSMSVEGCAWSVSVLGAEVWAGELDVCEGDSAVDSVGMLIAACPGNVSPASTECSGCPGSCACDFEVLMCIGPAGTELHLTDLVRCAEVCPELYL